MPMTVDQIVEQTRSMPQDVVAELVDRILLTMHGGQEPAAASAWSGTVQRRIAEIRSGQVQGIPGAVTSEKIRQIVGRCSRTSSIRKPMPSTPRRRGSTPRSSPSWASVSTMRSRAPSRRSVPIRASSTSSTRRRGGISRNVFRTRSFTSKNLIGSGSSR